MVVKTEVKEAGKKVEEEETELLNADILKGESKCTNWDIEKNLMVNIILQWRIKQERMKQDGMQDYCGKWERKLELLRRATSIIFM